MEGLDTNKQDRGKHRLWGSTKTSLKWLLMTAGVVALVGLLYISLIFVRLIYSGSQARTYAVALGDLDGDGDLDAFYANGKSEVPQPNTFLINQGGVQDGRPAEFQDSGQRLGDDLSRNVTLTDLDDDGDLEALVAGKPRISLFINDGEGKFTGRTLDRSFTGKWTITPGDLDGDGDLDILAGGCCGPFEPYNAVWVNQSGAQGGVAGVFRDSGQYMEGLGAEGVALGDLDGDGDLDAFFGNNVNIVSTEEQTHVVQPNTVGLNDGSAMLVDSGQRLGKAQTKNVALGDLDGDGDLDAYSANYGPDEVWMNAGGEQGGQPGVFEDSGQRLGEAFSRRVYLADLDGDGDLDAAVTIQVSGLGIGTHLKIRLNDGQGSFPDLSQWIKHTNAQAYALGDLDSDGDLDVLAGWYPDGYTIWWNQGDGSFKR